MSLVPRPGTLEALLREDGIEVPPGSGSERKLHCFAEGHEDKNQSMNVNVTDNVFHCHACKIKGNAWTYLREHRGMSNAEVARKLKAMGATEEGIAAWARQHESEKNRQKGLPKWVQAIPDIDAGRRKIAEHDYTLADGTLVCRVARYETDDKRPSLPKCRPFTPRTAGGWWCANPLSDLPPEDTLCEKRPLYRLPEMLKALEANPNRQIWIVEGEKCVDAVLDLKDPLIPNGPPPCTTSMFAKFDNKTDLTPLKGRTVLLMADQDEPGRANMLKLANVLAGEYGCAVKTFLPPGDAEPRPIKGYDVADAIYQGGWDAVLKWVKEVGSKPQQADMDCRGREVR